MDQIIKLALGALLQSASPTLQRPAARFGRSAALIFLMALAAAAGMMCLVAALWLAVLPEIGAVAATAVIGVAFLVIAGGLFLAYRAKTKPPVMVQPTPMADALEATAEIQQILSHTISKNIGPVLIATVLVGLLVGLRKGR
jgi:hypothetical protein